MGANRARRCGRAQFRVDGFVLGHHVLTFQPPLQSPHIRLNNASWWRTPLLVVDQQPTEITVSMHPVRLRILQFGASITACAAIFAALFLSGVLATGTGDDRAIATLIAAMFGVVGATNLFLLVWTTFGRETVKLSWDGLFRRRAVAKLGWSKRYCSPGTSAAGGVSNGNRWNALSGTSP